MAIDAYLQIDGIKGESTDGEHTGWIECQSVHFSLKQPKSATASTAGGHTAERVELSEVSLQKLCDVSSPILAQHCAMGKTVPKAVFEFFRADGDGKRVKYYVIELDNVLISHVAPTILPGVGMMESLGLRFSKISWKYTQQKIAGGAGGNTAGSWNLATNRPM